MIREQRTFEKDVKKLGYFLKFWEIGPQVFRELLTSYANLT